MFTIIFMFMALCSDGFSADDEGKWEILGIQEESKLIAYKSTFYKNDGEGGGAENCGYPDVPAGQGVTLGLWSVEEAKTIQKWEIYSSVIEEECISMAQAKKQLAAAKKTFAKKKIDITKAPKGIAISEDGLFEIIHKKSGFKNTFSVLVFDEIPIPGEEGTGGYLLKRWIRAADYSVVYALELEGVKIMASGLDVQFPMAYVIGDQVVFLQVVRSSSMRHQDISFKFTPPTDIK